MFGKRVYVDCSLFHIHYMKTSGSQPYLGGDTHFENEKLAMHLSIQTLNEYHFTCTKA